MMKCQLFLGSHLLASLLVNKCTKQQCKPTAFEWVISLETRISKNESTNAGNWQRLPDLLSRMDNKSLLFKDNLKLDVPIVGSLHIYNLIPK